MGKFDLAKIENVFREMAVDKESHSIQYKLYPLNSKSVYEENGSRLLMVKANVSVLVKGTGEKATFPVDFLKLPHHGSTGFLIRGKNRQVIDSYNKSYGWFVLPKDKDFKSDVLQLTSERGTRLTIFAKEDILYITSGKKQSDKKIELAKFLKAFTKESYKDLAMKIGMDNPYVLTSFGQKEPILVECIDEVLSTFRFGTRAEQESDLSLEDKYSDMYHRLFSPRYRKLGNTTGVRMVRSMSFRDRCKNMTLAKSITVAGKKYESGTVLGTRVLEEIDTLPVDVIHVYDENRKKYTLRKTSVYNFRAFGCVLEEDAEGIPAGTVLEIDHLKLLDQTNRRNIKVSLDGKVFECERKVFDGALKTDDIIGMLQVFLNTLTGLDLYHNVYDLTNQSVKTIELNAIDKLKSCCSVINSEIQGYIKDRESGGSLLDVVSSMERFDTDKLINEISSAESRESQQAELNNSIQMISKEYRAAKNNVKRGTSDMVGIQESQFGRLDPIESPESAKIGLVHTRTWSSVVDEAGFLCAPFIPVLNGKVISNEPVYLSAAAQEGQCIADWNETFTKKNEQGETVPADTVLALCDNTIMEVPVKDVRYKAFGPYHTMSPARMQIPLQEHSNPKRILMGSNHQKQSVPVIMNERPIVSSGGDSLLQAGIIRAKDVLNEYYISNRSYIDDPEDWFLQRKIKLVAIDDVNGFRNLYFVIEGVEDHRPMISIPFIQKASSGAMFSYRVNTENGCVYQGNDIVAHNFDVDIRKYNIKKHADFGPMKVDDSVFDTAVALSRNLMVALKTFESSTIDDAVTIKASVVGSNTLTVIDLYSETYKLPEEFSDAAKGEKEFEEFGYDGKEQHMGPDGLPKLGADLKPGDTIIGIKRIKQELSSKTGIKNKRTIDRRKTLEGAIEGKVVSSYISGKEATVILACYKPIEEGDKIAGRYGNKGVIAKIVPDHLMPFEPTTGFIPDIIQNPQGVPSRSNLSQILEAALGMAGKKNGEIHVITPYVGDTLEYVKKVAKDAGVHPVMMRDGRTGQWFDRPMNLGVVYILTLEHKVSHKMAAIGFAEKTDPVFNQPTKGDGHAGGQAFGEMETWCLMAVGAKKILQDLQSVQSDDLESASLLEEAIMEDPHEIDVEGTNNNDHSYQVLLRTLGVEAYNEDEEGIVFKPLTDQMIRGMSNTPVDLNNKDSLRSTAIFGATTNPRARFRDRTRWSWIPLHCEMVHPFWLVKGKINNYLLVFKEKANGKLNKDLLGEKNLKELVYCKAFIEEVTDEEGDTLFLLRKGEGGLTGVPALIQMLRKADLGVLAEYLDLRISRAKQPEKKIPLQKIRRGLDSFINAGLKLEDFIISSFPVMPLSFRPRGLLKNTIQDFDFYYRRIIEEVVRYRGSEKTPQDILKIYLSILDFCGLPIGKEFGSLRKTDKKHSSLTEYYLKRESSDDDHGKLRSKMLKKRILFSGRTVIIPSSDPKRLPTQVGVPFAMCLNLWRPQLISLLYKELDFYDMNKNQWSDVLDVMGSNLIAFNTKVEDVCKRLGKTSVQVYDQIYGLISAYVEGYKNPTTGEWDVKPRVCLVGRQPSLHKFSIRAYNPIIVKTKCIEIHPLVAKGYNADYDGDQMWIAALVNNEACEEAMEKLSPMHGIINPKNNGVILDHSQDMKLGIYYATMLHNNVDHVSKDDRYKTFYSYSSVDKLRTDVDLAYIRLHDLVVFSFGGNTYLSTAGRILFNALIPNNQGFTDQPFSNVLDLEDIAVDGYKDLMFDGLVTGEGISNVIKHVSMSTVTTWSYDTLSAEENILYMQALSEFGFKYADMSGISFLLEDLQEDHSLQGLIKKAEKKAKLINKRYYQGAIDENIRKSSLISLYTGMMKYATPKFISSFDRNNNIFIMFDSGARGSKGQIMQACGIIGVLQKAKGEILEVPVLSNYTKGNTGYETLLLSFSTRTGVASTQNETATAGEVTRTAVYMLSGFKIVEEDCGAGFEDFKIKYDKFSGTVISPEGESVREAVLLGKVVKDENSLKHLKYFLGDNYEITENALRMIKKHKLTHIECEDGVYQLKYSLDTLTNSLLFRREAEGLPHMMKGKFITKKTLKHIEDAGLSSVKVRTMLNCKSVGGVCAKCYGLLFDANRRPNVGDFVGYESAQSIGEPAAQLTMSLFHQGGAAGAAIDKGIDVLEKLLNTGTLKDTVGATITPVSGYVEYDSKDGDDIVFIASEDDKRMFDIPSGLIVENGEYVEKYEPLSQGFVIPAGLSVNPTPEEVKFRQRSLLEMYYRTFESNNIKDLNARHFEIFVRSQTSLVTVLGSNDPRFKSGLRYELTDIVKNAGEGVTYSYNSLGKRDVISFYSGMNAALSLSEFTDQLGTMVMYQERSKGSSMINDLVYGKDVTGRHDKVLTIPKAVIVKDEGNARTSENLKELEDVLLSTVITPEEVQDVSLDIDFDSIFDEDFGKPEESTEEPYINEEDELTIEPTESSTGKSMKLF